MGSIERRLRRLIGDERGVSAVEFAMLLPLMLTLYLGAVEVSQGIGADRKVTLTARTIADLVSQVSSIGNADMTNALNASSAVMAPFPISNLKVTVYERQDRRHRQGDRRLERHAQRHRAGQGLDGDAADRAQRCQHLADLERGAVHLQAGDRLCRHRHADAARTRSTCGRGCPTRWRAARSAASTGSAAPSSI